MYVASICDASYASCIDILIRYSFSAVSVSAFCDTYLSDSIHTLSALLLYLLSNRLALIRSDLFHLIRLLRSDLFALIQSTQIYSLWSDMIWSDLIWSDMTQSDLIWYNILVSIWSTHSDMICSDTLYSAHYNPIQSSHSLLPALISPLRSSGLIILLKITYH